MPLGGSERAPFWGSVAAALLCGCTASSDAMVEVMAPLPELPAAGSARVVFIRPSTYAEGARFPIVDHGGRFLGHSLPAAWFDAELAAGRYAFFAEGENTAAVLADLMADRTYFVEVAPKLGFFTARVQLLPIAPRFETWADREEWIAESMAFRLISPGASELDPEDIADIVRDGQATLSRYDTQELTRRTLRAEDGI